MSLLITHGSASNTQRILAVLGLYQLLNFSFSAPHSLRNEIPIPNGWRSITLIWRSKWYVKYGECIHVWRSQTPHQMSYLRSCLCSHRMIQCKGTMRISRVPAAMVSQSVAVSIFYTYIVVILTSSFL